MFHRESKVVCRPALAAVWVLFASLAQGFKTVNYSKLPLLTIQAVKELKAENDALKHQLEQQQKQFQLQQHLVDGLRQLVCQNHPQSEVCK